MFQVEKAAQAAVAFLFKAGTALSERKLITLMAFAERRALLRGHAPITGDDFIAAPEGFSLRRVEALVTGADADELWTKYIRRDGKGRVNIAFRVTWEDLSLLDDDALSVITLVWDSYAHWTTDELADLSRRYDVSPEYTEAEDEDGAVIPLADLMRRHGMSEEGIREYCRHISSTAEYRRLHED